VVLIHWTSCIFYDQEGTETHRYHEFVDLIRDERSSQIISLNIVANERGEEDATKRLVSR